MHSKDVQGLQYYAAIQHTTWFPPLKVLQVDMDLLLYYGLILAGSICCP